MILSFKRDFVPAVVAGTKPHTIRVGQRWKVGQSIQFYQDARQKSMAKFRPDGEALVVQAVKIERKHTNRRVQPVMVFDQIAIDGRILTALECETLAHSDGFDSADEMIAFFKKTHGLPFQGQLIHWTDLRY